jgi:hypothetical protein
MIQVNEMIRSDQNSNQDDSNINDDEVADDLNASNSIEKNSKDTKLLKELNDYCKILGLC